MAVSCNTFAHSCLELQLQMDNPHSHCTLLKDAACCFCYQLLLPLPLPLLLCCRWRHAGGVEDWAVQCRCGVTDDDGERMIVCDSCGFWVHTRCNGVSDTDEEPHGFVCRPCRDRAAAPAEAAAGADDAGAGTAAADAAATVEGQAGDAAAAAVGSKREREASV
jgi:hypothetical protein